MATKEQSIKNRNHLTETKKSRDSGAGIRTLTMNILYAFARKNKDLWPLLAVITFCLADFTLLALRAGGVL